MRLTRPTLYNAQSLDDEYLRIIRGSSDFRNISVFSFLQNKSRAGDGAARIPAACQPQERRKSVKDLIQMYETLDGVRDVETRRMWKTHGYKK